MRYGWQIGEEGLEAWMGGLGAGMSMSERSEKTEVKGKGLMQTYYMHLSEPRPPPEASPVLIQPDLSCLDCEPIATSLQ